AFAEYARRHPKQCKVVAIAEPRPETRSDFATKHGIADKHAFPSHTELLVHSDVLVRDGKERLAQAVVICVQDRMHAQLTIDFAQRGYHILCEKPLGVTVEECLQVTEEVEKSDFPYSPYAASLTELIHSKALGRLLHIAHLEPIGYYHFAHSYVRGHWQSEHTSAPIILTKSSHDLDIFCRWLHPLVPQHVASFGGLGHFRRERKPAEARARGVMRCLDCPTSVEQRCEYSAKRIYLSPVKAGMSAWPGNLIVDGRPTVEKMTRALEETPFGLCVYESANDVPDHQTISIQFTAPPTNDAQSLRAESPERSLSRSRERNVPVTGPTISFTIAAHTESICVRKTTMYFEHGEVIGDMSTYTVSDFRDIGRGPKRIIPPHGIGGGHGGGDWALTEAWLKAIKQKERGETVTALGVAAGVRDQLRVFMTGFAIEEARKGLKVVDCEEFTNRMKQTYASERLSHINIEYEPELP
ncbi:2306_t:CDS:2, partial [Acaulospora colombiana]